MLILILALLLQADSEIPKLIERLGADFLDDRVAARRELEKLGARAEVPLVEALLSADHRIRRACLEVLALLKSSKARSRAAELFNSDEDGSVQEAAFRLLQSLGAEAEEELSAVLSHASAEFRRGAVESLRTLQSPRSVKPLSELYDRETVPAVRDAVFRAMLSMPALAEGFLLKVLGTAEAKERREILQVLKGLDGAAVLDRVGRQFLVEADPEALKLAGEVLEKAGVRAEVHWVRGLEAAREGARALAAGGLKALKSRAGAAKAASLVLAEPNEAALEALADYLAAVGGAEAETAFLKGLREGSPAVKALSIRKLGELKIRTPLADVARAFRSEKEPLLRRACFDYLASLGKAAEQELLQALTDEDKLYRIEAAKALGEAGSEAAIPRLVEGLEDLDGGLRAAAEAALARLGTKALEAARQAAAKGTLKPRALESLETLVNRERVERELDRLVTDSGGTGFFAGRFMGLAEIPREISGPILIRLASDPQAQVRISARRERVQDYDALLRGLAVAALGELAVPGGKEALQKIVQEGESAPGEIHQEALLSLHRLGDAGPLDAHLKTLEARVEAGFAQKDPDEDAAAALFTRGLLLNRSGRRAEAAAAYERLVLAVDRAGEASRLKGELPMALYNLACLASLAGEKAKGVGLLVRAVKAGYRDRAWIEMDKDLDALRGEAGYRDLLADEALLPKPAPPK